MMENDPMVQFMAFVCLVVAALTPVLVLAMLWVPAAVVVSPLCLFFVYRGAAAAVRTWKLTSW